MLHFGLKYLYVLMFLASIVPMKNEIGAVDRRPESLDAIPAQAAGTQSNDLAIVQRLVDSYRRVANKKQSLGKSMWQMFFDTRHTFTHEIFLTGKLDGVANVLRNPHASDLFYGFDSLAVSLQPSLANPSTQQTYATDCMDSLVRFAEAMGRCCINSCG